jgi:NHL repeat-containing protein
MRHVPAFALASLLSVSTLVSGCSLKSAPVAPLAGGGAASSLVGREGSMVADAFVPKRLYVVQPNAGVLVYKQAGTNQQPIKTLTSGLQQPEGVTVDTNGDLYVTNFRGQSVSIFKRGANTPYKTLNDPNEVPGNAVIDSTGTVYVCNYEGISGGTPGPPGSVSVYAGGATSPTSTLPAPFGHWVLWCGLDNKHNLYAGYTDNVSTSNVWEFPGGSGPGSSLGLKIGFPGQMNFNSKGNLVIADEKNSKADTFKLPGTNPVSSIATPSGGVVVGLTLNSKSTHLYLADYATGQVYEYSYPKGTLIDTITPNGGSGDITGLAADPAAPL